MRIVVTGAGGRTGHEVVAQALGAGHEVVGFVRSADQLSGSDATVATGDATVVADLRQAFEGADAVVSTLGGSGATLIAESTRAIVAAAQATGVKRVSVLSSFAVQRERLSVPARVMSSTVMGKIVTDKVAGETLLRASDLDWRIVYATMLTNGERTDTAHPVAAGKKIGLRSKVSRSDVAHWLLAVTTDDRYRRSDLTITG